MKALSVKCILCQHEEEVRQGMLLYDISCRIRVRWQCKKCISSIPHLCLFETKDNLSYMAFKGEKIFISLKEAGNVWNYCYYPY